MPGSLPGIIIKLSADTRDAIQGLNRVKGALGETASTGDKLNAALPKVGAALAAAGAAAAAMAVKFGVDGVKAAMDDQVAMEKLATQMRNMGFAAMTDEVNTSIDAMQRQFGVSEDQLRPAFQRLLASTNDVARSQELLKVAMDVSAGTGKNLDTIVAALSRSADGSNGAIGRLVGGIDKATLKSADLDDIVRILSGRFGGSAQDAANTFKGKIERLGIAADELKESFGTGFLKAFSDAMGDSEVGAKNLMDQMKDLEPTMEVLGGFVGTAATAFVNLAKAEQDALKWAFSFGKIPDTAAWLVISTLANLVPGGQLALTMWAANAAKTADAADGASASTSRYTDEIDRNSIAWQRYQNLMRRRQHSGPEDPPPPPPPGPQIEKLLINWRSLAQGINAEIDGLALNMTGKSQVISGALVESFNSRKDAFKTIVSEQVQTIQNARNALDEYARSVGDTILGKINFSTETTDAEGKTVPMTPEQIVTAILGDISNQQNAVTAMAGIVTKLPEALAQKLLALPPTAQIGLANYLSDPANAALLATLNTNFTNLATTTETLLGVPMANAFTKVGGKSATAMIDEAMAEIKKQAGAFKEWVKDKLGTTITVKVNYDTSGFGGKDGNPATPLATGGIVTRPTFALIGEAGPEAVIPLSGGSSYGVGGSTYNISVSAGVGDPAAIGRTVVESIRAYERRSGKVFAAA